MQPTYFVKHPDGSYSEADPQPVGHARNMFEQCLGVDDECKHEWVANINQGGGPDFRLNRQMSPEPLTHVTCDKCHARTWMTAAQWEEAEQIRRRPNPAHGAPKPAGHNPVA